MYKLQKIKRKNLDIEKYSKALDNSLNYRIYAEYWYLDILTNEKWECWIYGDYEVIMPVPLQYKFGLKFVIQPTYCQQLGVFYNEEISDELFKEFERKLHKYRVRSYSFNEENTERYNPKGEKRVNYILDLSLSYSSLFMNYRKDKKRNLRKTTEKEISINETIETESYFQILKKYYPGIQQFNKNLLNELLSRKQLIQYTATLDNTINNHRMFMLTKNRLYVIASVRNKESPIDISSNIIDLVIQKYSSEKLILDFEGSMISGVANFNKGFGALEKKYTRFSNFNLTL